MEKLFNRRQALVALGAIGVSLPLQAQTKKTVSFSGYHSCESLKKMKKDKSLKPGMVVTTFGYFNPGDGGNGEYIIRESDSKLTADEGSIILLENDLYAELINAQTINYKMFGAVGDGDNDDGVQIKAAHAYANLKKISVVNHNGDFWIKETKGISIKTSTYWGSTVFHLDESLNSMKEFRFLVQSYYEPTPIEFTEEEKKSFLAKLKPGVGIIPEMAKYKNCMVRIVDSKDQIGFRSGARFKGQSWPRQEFFYVEEHGRIIGDIAWKFKDYTFLSAYNAETDYLTIEGGAFRLSGDNPGSPKGYWKNGIMITRSRTIIKNQWVGLEDGKNDVSLMQRSGFYSFSRVYDITMENVRLLPWEYMREGKQEVMSGTYGISMVVVMNSVFRNVTAEGSNSHWGVFGSNLNKNFRIENCQLNRVDIHFHCNNLTIKDSEIGYRGITVTGNGTLLIENSTCSANRFITFRPDYGSRWDGDIRIKNCRMKIPNDKECNILYFAPNMSFDYKYPLSFGKTIKIEDFVVDASEWENNDAKVWIFNLPLFKEGAQNASFPTECVFKDIRVEGREKGIRLMELRDFSKLNNDKKTDSELYFEPNTKMLFSNIMLEKFDDNILAEGEEYHLSLLSSDENETHFYPEITVEDCHFFVGRLNNCKFNLVFKQCILTEISNAKGKTKGSMFFSSCHFVPSIHSKQDVAFSLDAEQGTSFLNCELHAPLENNVPKIEQLNRLGFMELNKSIRYNHLHTHLGKDILTAIKNKGIPLQKEFIEKLKNNYETDD